MLLQVGQVFCFDNDLTQFESTLFFMHISLQQCKCGLCGVSEMFLIFVFYYQPFGLCPGVIGANNFHGHDITYSFHVNISTCFSHGL